MDLLGICSNGVMDLLGICSNILWSHLQTGNATRKFNYFPPSQPSQPSQPLFPRYANTPPTAKLLFIQCFRVFRISPHHRFSTVFPGFPKTFNKLGFLESTKFPSTKFPSTKKCNVYGKTAFYSMFSGFPEPLRLRPKRCFHLHFLSFPL